MNTMSKHLILLLLFCNFTTSVIPGTGASTMKHSADEQEMNDSDSDSDSDVSSLSDDNVDFAKEEKQKGRIRKRRNALCLVNPNTSSAGDFISHTKNYNAKAEEEEEEELNGLGLIGATPRLNGCKSRQMFHQPNNFMTEPGDVELNYPLICNSYDPDDPKNQGLVVEEIDYHHTAVGLSSSGNSLQQPIHEYAQCCDVAVVQKLILLLKADRSLIHARNILQQTPLHVAAQAGNDKAVAILLLYGADYNVQDVYAKTPIYYVAQYPLVDQLLHKLIEYEKSATDVYANKQQLRTAILNMILGEEYVWTLDQL